MEQRVTDYFKCLQDALCERLGALDAEGSFGTDAWHQEDKYGVSRVIEQGAVWEKGGVNFSYLAGKELPAAASSSRPNLTGQPFRATGLSLVLHPRNPFVPCVHLNLRFFMAGEPTAATVFWFGGGYDLTPCYGFEEDCVHWHRTAKQVCDRFDCDYYPRFKAWCDRYFQLKHRGEARGIGGLFFDDFAGESGNDGNDFESAFEFVRALGDSFVDAYLPIMQRRINMPYTERERAFQRYRRGRYVEFNLVFDRGTLFGLQSKGRTESILMSLPPVADWRYAWRAENGSAEERLTDYYLKPRDWLGSGAESDY